jgi:SAM-dependent methyltransferase
MKFNDLKQRIRNYKDSNIFEYQRVMHSISRFAPSNASILDVGCGFGRYLRPLSKRYKSVVGIETNPKTIKKLKKDGLKVYTAKEFEETEGKFDVVIMSHFIEHFPPSQLLEIMEGYLDRLNVGGILIIATPVLSENFYINFDHVRPYYPQSIEEVFGGKGQEVQYYARNTLKTERVWYRRSRLQVLHTSLAFNNETTKNLTYLANVLLAFLFRISFSLIGYRSGWIGVFSKV